MSGLAALGATFTDLILNAVFRGSIGTPPATVYFSLGESTSVTVPAEIAGVVRTPVKINRGVVSGADSTSYPYQSTGTVYTATYIQHPVDIYCTGLGANTYLTPSLLVYDAASAGNLLMVIEPYTTSGNQAVFQLINDDIVRVGEYLAYTFTNLDVSFAPVAASRGWGAPLFARGATSGTLGFGKWIYAIIVDWLFRGFDSMNDLYDATTYPNTYMLLRSLVSGNEITQVPRLAIPRTTGTWTAPAYVAPGTNLERKIANVNAFEFAPATASGSFTNYYIEFRVSNIVQSTDDLLYQIRVLDTLNFNQNDVISFPAGSLELVLN